MQTCNGHMSHVEWNRDKEFAPQLVPDDAPRFLLPHTAFRGDEGATLEIPTPALVYARRWHNEQDGEGSRG